jgi:hypothetical protein
LTVPNEESVMRAGAFVQDLPPLWQAATLDERRAIVLSVLDAVYVDVDRERVVTIQPKADFLPLLAAASPGWGLAGKRLLHGDPDGIRGYHAQWPFVAQVGGADVLLWVA